MSDYKFTKGGWIILVHETLERFAYYGFQSILIIYLNQNLKLSENISTIIYHSFNAITYLTPLIGAIIADNYWGRYRTISIFGIIYLFGYITISLSSISNITVSSIIGVFILGIGAGLIKSAVSAFGGDQVSSLSEIVTQKYFSLFYISINLGAFIALFSIPVAVNEVACVGDKCYPLGFGMATSLFVITYLLFVLSYKFYIYIEPSKSVTFNFLLCFIKSLIIFFRTKDKIYTHLLDYSKPEYSEEFVEDCKKSLKIIIVLSPLMFYWALFDQQGSTWTLQAKYMNRRLGNYLIKPSQIQSFNPILVIMLIPIFDLINYPILARFNILIHLPKRLISAYFIIAIAFLIAGIIQLNIESSRKLNVGPKGAKLNVINQFDKCDALIIINTKQFMLGIPQFSVRQVNIEPNEYNLTITCNNKNNTSIYAPLTINQNEMITGVLQASYEITFDKVRLSKNEYALVRYFSHTLIDIIEIRQKSVYYYISSKYQEIETGNYDIYCGYGRRLCGNYNILPGNVITIYVNAENNTSIFEEFTPSLIHVLWQTPQYLCMSCSEILCSVTAITYAYTAAPITMKSLMQSVYLITVFAGNLIVVIIESIFHIFSQTAVFFIYAVLVSAAGILNWILVRTFDNIKIIEIK